MRAAATPGDPAPARPAYAPGRFPAAPPARQRSTPRSPGVATAPAGAPAGLPVRQSGQSWGSGPVAAPRAEGRPRRAGGSSAFLPRQEVQHAGALQGQGEELRILLSAAALKAGDEEGTLEAVAIAKLQAKAGAACLHRQQIERPVTAARDHDPIAGDAQGLQAAPGEQLAKTLGSDGRHLDRVVVERDRRGAQAGDQVEALGFRTVADEKPQQPAAVGFRHSVLLLALVEQQAQLKPALQEP